MCIYTHTHTHIHMIDCNTFGTGFMGAQLRESPVEPAQVLIIMIIIML